MMQVKFLAEHAHTSASYLSVLSAACVPDFRLNNIRRLGHIFEAIAHQRHQL